MKPFGTALFLLASLVFSGSAFGADEATIQKGEKVFNYWCATCHGPGLPGTVALQTKYQGAKPALLSLYEKASRLCRFFAKPKSAMRIWTLWPRTWPATTKLVIPDVIPDSPPAGRDV
jgi:mono/diheme cytochrome c family protein